jgi:hypothetical protein
MKKSNGLRAFVKFITIFPFFLFRKHGACAPQWDCRFYRVISEKKQHLNELQNYGMLVVTQHMDNKTAILKILLTLVTVADRHFVSLFHCRNCFGRILFLKIMVYFLFPHDACYFGFGYVCYLLHCSFKTVSARKHKPQDGNFKVARNSFPHSLLSRFKSIC